MIRMWPHDGHVGVQLQEQYFFPLGVDSHFYANYVNEFSFVLYTNMSPMQILYDMILRYGKGTAISYR